MITGTGKGRLLRMAKPSTVPHVEQGLCGGIRTTRLAGGLFQPYKGLLPAGV